MHLDTGTLMATGAVTAGLSGVWLAWVWLQKRQVTALVWWAAANLVYGVAIGGLRIALSDHQPFLLLGALLLTNLPPALVWAGARRFRGARVPAALVPAGMIVWTVATAIGSRNAPDPTAAAISFTVWIVYLAAAVRELWLGRDETLPARWPLAFLLVIHAAVYAGGIVDVLGGSFLEMDAPPLESWFGLIYFEGLFYAMGTAVFMAGLAAERDERLYRSAASIDVLTGAANRRAFFDGAERMLFRCASDGAELSLIVFDLDRFKAINDTYGHQFGDRALRMLADTVRNLIRPADLFGRHGGEEFAVVLPGEGIDTAYAIAERVRRVFAEACRQLDDAPLGATVSAGVAMAAPGDSLERLMAAADQALYLAKAQGRNCVRRADGPPDDGGARVIRVA